MFSCTEGDSGVEGGPGRRRSPYVIEYRPVGKGGGVGCAYTAHLSQKDPPDGVGKSSLKNDTNLRGDGKIDSSISRGRMPQAPPPPLPQEPCVFDICKAYHSNTT